MRNAINFRCKEKRSIFLSDVNQFFNEGYSINDISKKIGITHWLVTSCLKDLGIKVEKGRGYEVVSQKNKASFNEKRKKYFQKIKELYKKEYSSLEIAKEIGKSRSFVNCSLRDMGIPVRTGGEINKIRYSKLSAEEKLIVTANARKARRHSPKSEKSRFLSAVSWQETRHKVGKFENEFAEALINKGLPVMQQAAWKRYNFDIMIGNLAVEIHNSTSRPCNGQGDFRKTIEAISSGISICYIWMSPTKAVTHEALDEVIVFYNSISENPSPVGQYRVIRSNGEIDSISRIYLDDTARIATLYHSLNS